MKIPDFRWRYEQWHRRHTLFRLDLDYPTSADGRPRWTEDQPHAALRDLLGADEERYRERLLSFRPLFPLLARIPAHADSGPHFINGFLPGMDAVCLYSMVATLRPRTYLEVGSGNSTLFVHRAIQDNGLATRIVSIDPEPRADVEAICDRAIRSPLETADLGVFEGLVAGDVVFFDCSHRVFTGSDVTVFFFEVMPRLPSGVFVQVHDICWPLDYPPEWGGRYYSEQYLFGAWMLGGHQGWRVVLPNAHVSIRAPLRSIIDELWAVRLDLEDIERHGKSLWLEKL